MTNLISKAFEGHNIRIITDQQGEPWFVAADIAQALEYRMASDMTRWIDEDERGTQIVRTPSGDQEMTVINESGLYSAILRSRKPEAIYDEERPKKPVQKLIGLINFVLGR